MNVIFVFIFFCLVSVQGTAKGCEELVEDFLTFRDGLLRYISVCNEYKIELDIVEDYLGFPLTSDEHWRKLFCDLESVDDLSDFVTILDTHIGGHIYQNLALEILKAFQKQSEVAQDIIESTSEYQAILQPWLVKTNFPNIWPVQNTDTTETALMMAKGDTYFEEFNIITYDNKPSSDYDEWAEALLNAGSLEDYLNVVNEDLIGDNLQCHTAMQDLFRDNEEFSIERESLSAFVRVCNVLDSLFDLIPE